MIATRAQVSVALVAALEVHHDIVSDLLSIILDYAVWNAKHLPVKEMVDVQSAAGAWWHGEIVGHTPEMRSVEVRYLGVSGGHGARSFVHDDRASFLYDSPRLAEMDRMTRPIDQDMRVSVTCMGRCATAQEHTRMQALQLKGLVQHAGYHSISANPLELGTPRDPLRFGHPLRLGSALRYAAVWIDHEPAYDAPSYVNSSCPASESCGLHSTSHLCANHLPHPLCLTLTRIESADWSPLSAYV